MRGRIDVTGDDVTPRALTGGNWDNADAPVAVCLHGFPDTAHGWRKVVLVSAVAGWRVVAPFVRTGAPAPTAAPTYRRSCRTGCPAGLPNR